MRRDTAMTPPRGELGGGLDSVVGGGLDMRVESVSPASAQAELPESAVRALNIMGELDRGAVKRVLSVAAEKLRQKGKDRDEVIMTLSVFATEMNRMSKQDAEDAISGGVSEHDLRAIGDALTGEDDVSEEAPIDQKSDEADGLPFFISEFTTADDLVSDDAHSEEAEASRNIEPRIETDEPQPLEEAEAVGVFKGLGTGEATAASSAARLVREVMDEQFEKERAEQEKRDIAREHDISVGELSLVRSIAAGREIDFESALAIYKKTVQVVGSKIDDITVTEANQESTHAEQESAEIDQAEATETDSANDADEKIRLSRRSRARGRGAVALIVSLGLLSTAIIGGATTLSDREKSPVIAESEIDDTTANDVEEIVDGVLLDSVDDNEPEAAAEDVAGANEGRSDRQAEDGFDTIEDFFPGIDSVGETVTNYSECITYINQQHPVEERLPEAYVKATMFALMKYSSDGYLENESRLNPEMQGLYARSPNYYNDRFEEIVGEQEASIFRSKLEVANEQDSRTLIAYQQNRVEHEDVRVYVRPGLNAFYEKLADEGIDIDTIPAEYEREAMTRLFLHYVMTGFGSNDRIAASTDESEGHVITLLRDMMAGETTTVDGLDDQDWNKIRMAAAAENPVDCSREKIEELLG